MPGPTAVSELIDQPNQCKDVNGGATVWTTTRDPEAGWQPQKWAATPYEDLMKLEPAGRGAAVIFLKPVEVFATAEEAWRQTWRQKPDSRSHWRCRTILYGERNEHGRGR